jgi:hypothetical protein
MRLYETIEVSGMKQNDFGNIRILNSRECPMTKREIGGLAFKIGGIYLLLQAILQLPAIFYILPMIFSSGNFAGSGIFNILGYAAGALLTLLVSLFAGWRLLNRGEIYAARFFPDESGPRMVTASIPRREILEIAFCIVGLIAVVYALPKLMQAGLGYLALFSKPIFSGQSQGANVWMRSQNLSFGQFVGALAQLLIGLWLLFRANWLVDRLERPAASPFMIADEAPIKPVEPPKHEDPKDYHGSV